MSTNRETRLAGRGWRSGSVQDFLGLTDEEAAYVELKIQLAKTLRAVRRRRHLTQVQVARLLGSSQSRVAKMESGDADVSLDLLFRSLLRLGTSTETLARVVRRCA